MRPRKVVLLLAEDELQRRVWRFVFEIRGHYRVVSGSRIPRCPGKKLTKALCEAEVAVVSGRTANQLAQQAREMLPDIKLLFNPPMGNWSAECPVVAEHVLLGKVDMREMLECIRVLAMRKHGPRGKKITRHETLLMLPPAKSPVRYQDIMPAHMMPHAPARESRYA